MATQSSPFKFTGEIGDVVFFKSKSGGYMAREKGGIAKGRILTDPAYERTRENMTEFSRAGAASKLMRQAFRPLLKSKADTGMASRLTKEMVKVVRADALNDRGLRNVLDGELILLENFEFNELAPLDVVFPPLIVNTTMVIDRASGALTVTIGAFDAKGIAGPEGASHFMLRAGGAELDFETRTHLTSLAASAAIALGAEAQPQPEITLVANVPPASTKPLFLVFGIDFLTTSKNGKSYPLNSGQYNAMKLVRVDA